MAIYIQRTTVLLNELALTLKSLNLWQTEQLSELELSSSAPFCCDVLTFEQWLQFVFIPQITLMISQGQALPNKIALSPMAEESFKSLAVKAKPLLCVINKIDQTLTEQEGS